MVELRLDHFCLPEFDHFRMFYSELDFDSDDFSVFAAFVLLEPEELFSELPSLPPDFSVFLGTLFPDLERLSVE